MNYLASDCVMMCPHGGQVNLKMAESKHWKGNGSPLINYNMLAGSPITGCSIAGPGLKPCTTIASAVAGDAPMGFSAPGETYCLPFVVCVTDGSPGGPTMVSAPGNSGMKIKPGMAVPAVAAAKAAVENSSVLTEAQKEEALAALAKVQKKDEDEAAKEKNKEDKEKTEFTLHISVKGNRFENNGELMHFSYMVEKNG